MVGYLFSFHFSTIISRKLFFHTSKEISHGYNEKQFKLEKREHI